ncbi:BTAD domain-containing putative transcriptional regulator [Streptomyces sp. ACA25]|uniref:AfsR/SARP family transcriptional regulator n=1 Tax=Streptomyces sp. ACA25 TaxID=3022596 RepID=UPI0023079E98|nr:BTAD domain-containing putative transcriptional regulator [Streptomyces sp. ACA25]MDB1090331.1 BTAD domain-containing putative transcriptional regulator [Streptomyces sp. ACA25]
MARFRVLGPLEIHTSAGVAIDLPQARQRELLSILLLCANQPLSADRLISALWGNRPSRSAPVTLRSHLSSIRRLLLMIPRLETHSRGYLFRLEPGELDVDDFERSAARGSELFQQGAHARAVPLLRDALDLWRDPPLSDLPQTAYMQVVADRLTDERRSVQAAWVDARLAQGDHAGLAGWLSAQLATDQLNEHMWAQLMTALYLGGRRIDALDAYNRVRNLLASEFGLQPGEELRELHARILNGEPTRYRTSRLLTAAVAPFAGPDPGPGASPGAGAGAEPLGALAAAPADQTLPRVAIPADLPGLVGRENEIAELTTLLTAQDGTVPVAFIEGPPGSGKTALAVRSAHTLEQHFTDGCLFLPMAGSSEEPPDPRYILDEALSALGRLQDGTLPSLTTSIRALRQKLNGRRLLVIVDDPEPSDWVEELLPDSPGAAVIVTSRQPPAFKGSGRLSIGGLSGDEAERLLARTTREPAVITGKPPADKLLLACGRTPLAVRMVGGLLSAPTAPTVTEAARWVRRYRDRAELTDAPAPALRASLAAVWRILDEHARDVVSLLAQAGPLDITPWMIHALLGIRGNAAVLENLADVGLLSRAGAADTGDLRYQLHGALRRQLRDFGPQPPEQVRRKAHRRLLTGWLELAELADRQLTRSPFGPLLDHGGHPTVLPPQIARLVVSNPVAWFQAEQAGLFWAAQRLSAAGQHASAARLASYQAAFHYHHGRLDDATRLWHAVIEAATRDGETVVAARSQLQLAAVVGDQHPIGSTLTLLEQSMRVLEQVGDQGSMARGHSLRSLCAEKQSRFGEMKRHAEQGLSLSRKAGDRLAELLNLRMLGLAESYQGNQRLGRLYCSQSLVVARELREPFYEVLALETLTRVGD